ncbi:hypothetical protein V8F20_006873 [Naviculisporaceae sp. PSN 640]
MPPVGTHVPHDELFTGPAREHIVGAKAATLILRGVITTGQPPDAPSRQSCSRSSNRSFGSSSGSIDSRTDGSGIESGNTTPTATTPTHLSERMAALFAGIPTPSPTPSPENSSSNLEEVESKENQPPPSAFRTPSGTEKAKDKRIGPNGPRPMMRRVVSATGVGLGVRGRGLAGKFAAGAGARGRAVSANATVSGLGGSGGTARRRSSRLMNMCHSSGGESHDGGVDDDIDVNDNERLGGQAPPCKKIKKTR